MTSLSSDGRLGLPYGFETVYVLMVKILTLIFACGFAASASAQSCPNRTTLAELEQNMDATENAFINMDVELFTRSIEDLGLKLPCVRDTLPPKVAARYHRVVGIRLYANGNEMEAFQALQAARTLDAAYTFPAAMFPPGHELVVQYDALDPKDRNQGRVLKPRDLIVHFDGTETRKRPVGRATLLQLVTKDGAIRTTRFLQPNDLMPNYEARPRLRKPILIGTAISAGIAAALYVGALLSESEFNKDELWYTMADLERLRRRTNTLVGLSATFAGLAIGGGITIVIVGDR